MKKILIPNNLEIPRGKTGNFFQCFPGSFIQQSGGQKLQKLLVKYNIAVWFEVIETDLIIKPAYGVLIRRSLKKLMEK